MRLLCTKNMSSNLVMCMWADNDLTAQTGQESFLPQHSAYTAPEATFSSNL